MEGVVGGEIELCEETKCHQEAPCSATSQRRAYLAFKAPSTPPQSTLEKGELTFSGGGKREGEDAQTGPRLRQAADSCSPVVEPWGSF